jgi:hypothetical protein
MIRDSNREDVVLPGGRDVNFHNRHPGRPQIRPLYHPEMAREGIDLVKRTAASDRRSLTGPHEGQPVNFLYR